MNWKGSLPLRLHSNDWLKRHGHRCCELDTVDRLISESKLDDINIELSFIRCLTFLWCSPKIIWYASCRIRSSSIKDFFLDGFRASLDVSIPDASLLLRFTEPRLFFLGISCFSNLSILAFSFFSASLFNSMTPSFLLSALFNLSSTTPSFSLSVSVNNIDS